MFCRIISSIPGWCSLLNRKYHLQSQERAETDTAGTDRRWKDGLSIEPLLTMSHPAETEENRLRSFLFHLHETGQVNKHKRSWGTHNIHPTKTPRLPSTWLWPSSAKTRTRFLLFCYFVLFRLVPSSRTTPFLPLRSCVPLLFYFISYYICIFFILLFGSRHLWKWGQDSGRLYFFIFHIIGKENDKNKNKK